MSGKLKLKGLVKPEKMFKKSFQLKESQNDDLDQYVEFLEDEHEMKVTQQDVLASMVFTLLSEDKDFNKWKQEREKEAEKPVKKEKAPKEPVPEPQTQAEEFNLTG